MNIIGLGLFGEILLLLASLGAMVLPFYILYRVIKAGVRDGIKEARFEQSSK